MCKYQGICWRYVYSKYLLDKGEYPCGTAPKQIEMVLNGYAVGSDLMDKKRSIFAKNFPHVSPSGAKENICPMLLGYSDYGRRCEEFSTKSGREQRLAAFGGQNRLATPVRRSYVSKDIKSYVAHRDKFTCVYCNRHNTELQARGIRGHIDHVIPLDRGGHPTDAGNLCFSCAQCNQEKKNQIWERGCRIGVYT